MAAHDLAQSPDVPAPATSVPSSRSMSAGSGLASAYRSLFVIGRGGMGTVEAALAIEPPRSERELEASGTERRPEAHAYERIVALKRLLPDSARDKRRVDMFLREARVAAMLDHPNVVRAYDYGEVDGELYLAMEYVEGQPLSRVLKALVDAKQRLPASVAAWILAEICRGLHAAHELTDPSTAQALQLVHRDVSPQNVMVGYDGRVRLLDFGVAKIETESVTKTGEVKGKTAYMSPEQAMGDPLDRRSDLFSVGAVLFECLALRRMWGDGTDMEVIRKLALESPPALDAAGVDLPLGLADLYGRLVARNVDERPKTALEVASALDTFVGDDDAAPSALRGIMEAHFAEQADERRARLAAALDEVAPEQADELRESMLPTTATKGSLRESRRRATASTAPDATPERREETKKPSGTLVLGLGGAVLVAVVAWRALGGSAGSSGTTTTTSPAVSTATTTTTTSTPTPTPLFPVATASTTTSTSATATATANPAGRASAARGAPSGRATASVRTAPSVTPPAIDEKPF